MKLLVAIPAYNEEASIEDIISRSLAARDYIVASSPVSSVEITVVSDGSTDRTVERAQPYSGRIQLIVFAQNRGYGAAIQEAWRRSDAELLGFLDADGTCDPRLFASLCTELEKQKADVAVGCRLNPGSHMPPVRRIGNALFALLLGALSSASVRDTSSGMRVVRRESIPKLLPLPDGLHFTPAMSARALLGTGVRIVEVDMPYHERKGRSKLQVGRDGLRFLQVILQAAFLYRPSRPLGVLGLALLAASAALMLTPIWHYLRYRSVSEWMIYRFVVAHLGGTAGGLLLGASYLTGKMARIALSDEAASSRTGASIGAFLASRLFWTVPLLLILAGGSLVAPSFLELVRTGATYEHWSRFIAMSFLFSSATILIVTRAVDYVLDLVAGRLAYWKSRHSGGP